MWTCNLPLPNGWFGYCYDVEMCIRDRRYTDCPNVSKSNGVWPACGINEANVAMTATETITSNARVVGADPYVWYQEKKGRNTKDCLLYTSRCV